MERKHTMEELIKLRNFSDLRVSKNHFGYILTENFTEKGKGAGTVLKILSRPENRISNELKPETGAHIDLFGLSDEADRFAFTETKDDLHILNIGRVEKEGLERIILPGEIFQIGWHGQSILLLMKEPLDGEKKEEIEKGNDGIFLEEDLRYSSIYLYEPGNELKKVTSGLQVWEFSSSGSYITFVASDTPDESSWYDSRLYMVDLDSGNVKQLYDPKPRTLTRPVFSPDRTSIAFLVSHWSDRGVTAGDIFVLDTKTGRTDNITEGMKRSFTDVRYSPDGSIHSLFQESAVFGISEYDGNWSDIWSETGSVEPSFAPEFAFDGSTYYVAFSDPANPAEICSIDSKGNRSKLTQENIELNDLKPKQYEIVTWKSPDGMEIQGILRSENPNLPLVVFVHGGPTSSSKVDFAGMSTIFADRGYSVFQPNYRGSTGFGREFAEANIGDMGGRDLEDILTGINYLRESGKVKTESIFITGGSYGGFIVDLAITRTDIFSAAASLFGISDWMSFHGMSNIPRWDSLYYADSVYSRRATHTLFDPLSDAEKVNTPLLLLHGINDPTVPVGQSYEMYRKLKEMGKAARLLLFPREGHGFREKFHKIQMIEEMVKWFDSYLK